MTQLYTHVGTAVATIDGKRYYRTTSNLEKRAVALKRGRFKKDDINFHKLPSRMTRIKAIEWLRKNKNVVAETRGVQWAEYDAKTV
jgi:hypothetical protein